MKKSFIKASAVSMLLCIILSACDMQKGIASSMPTVETSQAEISPSERSVPYNQAAFPSVTLDEATIEAQALALADQLITYTITNVPMEGNPTDRQLFDLAITTSLYTSSRENAIPAHPYNELFDISKQGGLYATCLKSDVDRMVYEVFGVSDWKYINNDLLTVNENNEQIYNIALEAGFSYTNYSYENSTADIQNDGIVVVSFDLFDTPGWPNSEFHYGPHEITFQIMEEYDRQFLRFISYLPANTNIFK